MNVRLSKEQQVKILNSGDIYKVMQQILLRENKIRRNQEHFWVVGLDNSNKILFIELISLGAVNRVQVNPPEVFRMAIYKLAVNMILIHNHPSGSMIVSEADKDLTDKMLKAGKMLKIEVLDHLIISEEEYFSFDDKGLMAELRKSDSYRILDNYALELKALKHEKNGKREVAKKLKEEGITPEIIKKATGLTLTEIKKL